MRPTSRSRRTARSRIRSRWRCRRTKRWSSAYPRIKGYAPLFEKAFGSTEITMARVAQAIASPTSARWCRATAPSTATTPVEKDALSPAAVRGMALFNGKANCVTCHAGFNFTDESYHNLGVGDGQPEDPDLGRFAQTKAESERGAFKTPTLRNITQTRPTCTTAPSRRSWPSSSSTTAAAIRTRRCRRRSSRSTCRRRRSATCRLHGGAHGRRREPRAADELSAVADGARDGATR